MKKRILILLIITLFSCCYSYADDLPLLPSESHLTKDNSSKEEESFWQKIKGFFGFGTEETKSKELTKQETTASKQKSDDTNLTGNIENNKTTDSAIEDPAIANGKNQDSFIDSGDEQLSSSPEQSEFEQSITIDEDIQELFADTDITPAEDSNKAAADKPSEETSVKKQSPVQVAGNEKESSDEKKSFIDLGEAELPVHQDNNDNNPIEVDEDIKELFATQDTTPDTGSQITTAEKKEQITKQDNKPAKEEVTEEVNPEIKLTPIAPQSDKSLSASNNTTKKDDQDESVTPEKSLEEESADIATKPEIDKFKQQLKKNIASNRKKLPKIPEDEIKKVEQLPQKHVTNIQGHEHTTLEKKQRKFVSDEAKVLILPNDDIVLGKLTEKAAIAQMDVRSYVQLFNKNYRNVKIAREMAIINEFIDDYEENFNSENFSQTLQERYYGLNQAFKAIKRNDLPTLIIMLDNYNILQLRDSNNNNLLHMAAYTGNYPAAKLLLMKGINLNAKNNKHQSPLFIARKKRNPMLRQLLEKAGAK